MTNSKNEIKNDEITETVAKLEDMKMEIDEKNEEVKQLQKEMAKMKKEYDAKYIEVVEEMNKVSENLIQVQKEQDIYCAKLEVIEKREKEAKIEKNMILFSD